MSTSNEKKFKAQQEAKEKEKAKRGIKERVLDLETLVQSLSASYASLSVSHNTLLGRLDQEKYKNDEFKQKMQVTTESVAGMVRLMRDSEDFTEDNLSEAIAKNQEDRLISQTDDMIKQGLLKETEEVGKESFIISKEFDEEGKLIARRNQFPLSRLVEELQKEFIGKKVGDSVTLKEGNKIDILQIFNIIEPKPEKAKIPEEVEALNKALEAGKEGLKEGSKAAKEEPTEGTEEPTGKSVEENKESEPQSNKEEEQNIEETT